MERKDPPGYDLEAIRQLLLVVYSGDDLRGLLDDAASKGLARLRGQLDPDDSLADLVGKIIRYAEDRGLVDDLLEEIRRTRPREYADLEPKLRPRLPSDSADPDASQERREPIPEQKPLFEVEGVEVFASLVKDDPIWNLQVNGLVVPLGPQAGMQGNLVQALKDPLGKSKWRNLVDQLKDATGRRVEPLKPVHVPLEDELGRELLRNAPKPPEAARWRPDLEPAQYQVIAATAHGLAEPPQLQAVVAEIVRCAARHGVWHLAIPTLGTGQGQFTNQGKAVGEYIVRGVYDVLYQLDEGAIGEITLTTRDQDTFEAMLQKANNLTRSLPQRLVSDEARGDDLLDIDVEAGSLAEAVLLEGVKPPLAVGILGSWGSGKTFVMNRMRRRMLQIRSYEAKGWLTDPENESGPTYVGHVYPIEFNAWTYAKSNLWASLMHKIFTDLNRQLTLENRLIDALVMARLKDESQPAEKPVEAEPGGAEQDRIQRHKLVEVLRQEGLWPEILSGGVVEPRSFLQDEQGQKLRAEWKQRGESADTLQPHLEALGKEYMELRREESLKEWNFWPTLFSAREQGLRSLLETELGRNVLIEWEERDGAPEALWTYLQQKTRDEMDALEDLRDQLHEARKKLAGKAVWTPVVTKLKAVLSESAWQKLEQKISKDDADVLMALQGQGPDIRSMLKQAGERPVETMALMLFAVAVVVVPRLLGYVNWPSAIVTVATAVASVGAGVGRVFLHVQEQLNRISDEFAESLEAEQARLVAGQARHLDTKELREAGARVAELEAQVRHLERRIGMTSRCRSLVEFIQSRLEDQYYEKQLGLMHRVECDLRELTDALYIHEEDPIDVAEQKRELFPRGQPRVVLFIDDLDRCPPRRVVQVLEAVQLLLKTELFVVVLGLDTRYVTRALEKAYVGILAAQGDPSGLDYIEKILTLPYRVHPVASDAVEDYLKGQAITLISGAEEETRQPPPQDRDATEETGGMEGTSPEKELAPERHDRKRTGESQAATESHEEPEPLPPYVVAFQEDEYEAMLQVCQAVVLTPRSLKRITNVMKLAMIFWHRTRKEPTAGKVRTVSALLALSARYPEIMRDAFVELGQRYREPPNFDGGIELGWHAYFTRFVEEYAESNQFIQRWRVEFLADVKKTFQEGTQLSEIDERSFNLARSFSFVGDPTDTVEE